MKLKKIGATCDFIYFKWKYRNRQKRYFKLIRRSSHTCLSFKEKPNIYMITDNVVDLISVIKDKTGNRDFFKRISFKDVPEEMKVVILNALENVF